MLLIATCARIGKINYVQQALPAGAETKVRTSARAMAGPHFKACMGASHILHDTGSRLTRILRLQKWNAALTALCPPFFPGFRWEGTVGRQSTKRE